MASSPQSSVPESIRTTRGGLDPMVLRRDFPILERRIDGKPLVYLDNAATSQKPGSVLEAMERFYREYNANVHRGIHLLSEEATRAYEGARTTLSRFIGAPEPATCIFTRNTTEAINLVARTWGDANIGEGDEILVTEMEHHSNIVPWQMLAERSGARVRFLPITDEGRLDLDALDGYLNERTRVVALVHVSNVLGTINPVREIARRAHEAGAKVVVDGAQSAAHLPVNVQELDVDFFAFSGHKMCGPTGAGMLYGKKDLLESMPPFLGGGEMIDRVRKEGTTYNVLPHKFEAGTPNIAEAIGMGAAAEYLQGIGLHNIHEYEMMLGAHAIRRLSGLEGIRILGPGQGEERAGLVTFRFEAVHPHDLSTILDQDGIAIRAGHHCTQVLHDVLGEGATARASMYFYNTTEELDLLADACRRAVDFFS